MSTTKERPQSLQWRGLSTTPVFKSPHLSAVHSYPYLPTLSWSCLLWAISLMEDECYYMFNVWNLYPLYSFVEASKVNALPPMGSANRRVQQLNGRQTPVTVQSNRSQMIAMRETSRGAQDDVCLLQRCSEHPGQAEAARPHCSERQKNESSSWSGQTGWGP